MDVESSQQGEDDGCAKRLVAEAPLNYHEKQDQKTSLEMETEFEGPEQQRLKSPKPQEYPKDNDPVRADNQEPEERYKIVANDTNDEKSNKLNRDSYLEDPKQVKEPHFEERCILAKRTSPDTEGHLQA